MPGGYVGRVTWRPAALAGAVMGALLGIAACGAPPARGGPAPRGEAMAGILVTRVVDGDTIHVDIGGEDVTVRLIAIDTPETVKPGSPVDCFGPQASRFAQHRLAGRRVTLELDQAQPRQDRYGRLLAYVWVEGPGGLSLFNLEAVEAGYAEELQYGPRPGAWQAELRAAEERAMAEARGRWGTCPQMPGP